MASNDEQTSLLKEYYANEAQPETKSSPPAAAEENNSASLVADGVPVSTPEAVGYAVPSVTGVPVADADHVSSSTPWSTGLLACLGNNDEFFSSDLEVCLLGSCAPCLLYATNVERLYPTTENTFTNHFLSYSGLLLLGDLIFGCNALAPCFSATSRSEIRQRYNLMGTGECFAKSCGCSSCYARSQNREFIDSMGDFAVHYLCHQCALCQEGREIRRRMPHPGFFRSYNPMSAPSEQTMST